MSGYAPVEVGQTLYAGNVGRRRHLDGEVAVEVAEVQVVKVGPKTARIVRPDLHAHYRYAEQWKREPANDAGAVLGGSRYAGRWYATRAAALRALYADTAAGARAAEQTARNARANEAVVLGLLLDEGLVPPELDDEQVEP